MNFFMHPQGLCESENIGNGTRVWAFTHILPGAVIGEECNICDHVFIENDVRVGDRVTIKSGVQLWDGITLEDDVFVGPNATFTNDKFPRSKHYPDSFKKTHVGKNASIGANATILPGITIGQYAMIGAGAVVVKSVPEYAIVVGNPAKIIGFSNTQNQIANDTKNNLIYSKISGVTLHTFPVINDARGSLSVAEFEKNIPFNPKRYFLVYNNLNNELRGEHAHKKCHQFLIAVNGSCKVAVDDGKYNEVFTLDAPNLGLYMPPKIWGSQYEFSQDAVLLVFASDFYDCDDYIREYQEYRTFQGLI